MATEAQKRKWKEEAEARLAARDKRDEATRKNKALQMHLRKEQAAADQEAKARKEALKIWMRQGGSAGAFEAQWDGDDGIYAEIIRARVVRKMTGSSAERAKAAGQVPVHL